MNDYNKILSNLKILYAEDNEQVRKSMTKTLNIIFKKVLVAKNGQEALNYYLNEKVDIVLLDYIMPILDGSNVSHEIRKIDKDIPIIIASGYIDKDKLLEAIDLSVIKYIEKPIKFETLNEAFIKSVIKLQVLNRLHVNLGEFIKYDCIKKVIINAQNLEIKLTKQEIQLIELFIQNKSYLVSKDMIRESVFDQYVEENTIRNLIYRIRKKLSPKKVETVKDLGYIMH
jgi:DNA-binding response OmpR family regulator